MCQGMSTDFKNHEGSPGKNFRHQLAATVRSIQWSYGIFWALSDAMHEVLVWSDGYYNGDIKTRKTTQPTEFRADNFCLQRSEQLRELYNSLSTGDCIHEVKRPSASLSPEDLTDTEWYYLVCMSFAYKSGECLPGKAFATSQHIWLTNAQFADCTVFSRSLLAKSAAIQTIMCLPFMGGILEFGTTELVLEDLALQQHVASTFWEVSYPVCSEQSRSSSPPAEIDEGIIICSDDHNDELLEIVVDDKTTMTESQIPLDCSSTAQSLTFQSNTTTRVAGTAHAEIYGELQNLSPNNSSNKYSPKHPDESLQMKDQNDTCHFLNVRDEHFLDDDFNYVLHNSASNECLSQYLSQKILSSPEGGLGEEIRPDYLQEGHYMKLISLDVENEDSHYRKTLAAILRNSRLIIPVPIPKNPHTSCFKAWRAAPRNAPLRAHGSSQKLLKNILVDIAWMPGGQLVKTQGESSIKSKVWKSEADDVGASHVLSERRRREKLNEKFIVLRSLLPSITKVDKASILADTIQYVKQLERRVEELECSKSEKEPDRRGKRKHTDVAERTSDNYCNNNISKSKKTFMNKRKSPSTPETEAEDHEVLLINRSTDVNVTIVDKEVLIELQCPWREFLLLEIIEAISSIQLDTHSIQSSSIDGTLALTLKAKFVRTMISRAMIKRAVLRIVRK